MLIVSLGIRIIEDISSLENIINLLYKKGIIIVSAFDNNGAISYPAALKYVIGVDISDNYIEKGYFEFYDNKIVDVVCANNSFRVKWVIPQKIIIKGSSFATAYIASKVFDYIIMYPQKNALDNILSYLMRSAVRKYTGIKNDTYEVGSFFSKSIKKAIVFPFNKEIHSIVRFYDLLTVTIEGYYDIRQSGLIGVNINSIVKCDIEDTIKDYKKIEWESGFDTVILGHTKKISEITKVDYLSEFISKCDRYNKKLYSFDDVNMCIDKILNVKNRNNFYSPIIDSSFLSGNTLGKLRMTNTPIVSVFGTSSCQGKYTLQLMLRKQFLKEGYKVSQIGTEPSGYLFGFNQIYPMGYGSTVYVERYNAISVLNEMIYYCDKSNPDIILTGCQSGTVPYVSYNYKYITLPQIEFILGIQPDLAILCINSTDDFEYIKRSISFLEGICKCKVIALVVFPLKINMNSGMRKLFIREEEFLELKKQLSTLFVDKEILRLESEKDIYGLYVRIIKTLAA